MCLVGSQSRPRARRAWASVLALCVLAACGKQQPAAEQAQATQTPAVAPQQPAPQQAVSAQVAAMGAEPLRAAAGTALREQRLYAPAGNNAMEYYVALRDKAPGDAAVASALTDLMPYALIATEQSIARDDFAEAQRLYALMERADAQAPALPRLKQSIADAQASLAQRTAAAEARTQEQAQRQAQLERERQAKQQQVQQTAAQQGAPPRAAAQAAAPQRAAEPGAADEQRAAGQAAAGQRVAEPPPAPPAAPPAQAAAEAPASGTLRAVSTPSPAYPSEALRAGESGEVVVEFTVNPDGSVSHPRVVRATPPRVFDRAALNAVRRWRFQPVAAATTTRRTIGFKAGNE